MSEDQGKNAGGLNRRQFVSGAAVLATAVGAANASASSGSDCAPAVSCAGCDYDVIVIGGGFSGVTAARDAHKSGLKTLLLEARNRLGGRTFSAEFEGQPIELGGTWIHYTQPFVWAEAQRYQQEIVETPGAVPDVMYGVMPDGRRLELTAEQAVEAAMGWEAYCARGREVLPRPYDLLHNRAAALEAERILAMDHLETLDLTPLQHTFVEAMISLIVSGDAGDMSYLEVLRFHLLGGGYFPTFMDSTTRFQLREGTESLLGSIAGDGGAEVRLAAGVKAVHDRGDRVEVTTLRGEKLSSGAVISTVPMNTIDRIDFQPPLPGGVIEACRQRHPGRGVKVYMKVAGDVGNVASFGAHLPLTYVMTYKQAGDYTLLVGFAAGDERFDPYDEESVQEALRQHLPGASVLSVMHYDWNNDPYSLGTWATYRPGWVGKYYDQFQQDAGRVFFASGDHGEGWRGTIDSAIGAGALAARKVHETLRKEG